MIGDWGSDIYIASQIFITISYCFLALTYFITNRGKLLLTTIASNLIMGIGFVLLGGWTGLAMCLIAISRDVTSSIINTRRKKSEQNKTTTQDKWLLALWISLLTIATGFTFDGFASVFAYLATLLFTISIWQKDGFIYRLLGIFVGIFWIVYNAYLQSFMGLTLESALLLFVIIGFVKYIKDSRKKVSIK